MKATKKQEALKGEGRPYRGTCLGIAVGGVLLLSGNAVSAAAQFVPTGTVLAFAPGAMGPSDMPQSGSWFAFEVAPNFLLHTLLAPGADGGLVVGVPQAASGSHSGCTLYGTEVAPIDAPWCFFGNIGMHFSFGNGVMQDSADPALMDMSGWAATWNGIPQVLLNESVAGGPGRAVFDCATDCASGDAFTLDYHGRVPFGDPSGFGGVGYVLHLEGFIQSGSGRARIALENVLNAERCVEATGPAGAVIDVNGFASVDSSGGNNLAYAWTTASGASGAGGSFSFTLGVDGDETVTLTTTDLASGDAATSSLGVCVSDTTPPSVIITKPLDGATLVSNDFSLGVKVQDAVDTAITSYDVEVHMAATVSLDAGTGESTVRLLKGSAGAETMAMHVKVTAADASANAASDLITVYKKHDSR